MRIRGSILDREGTALSGSRIEARGANQKVIASAESGPDGRFAMSGEGVVTLAVFPPHWGTKADAVRFLPYVHRIEGVPRPEEAEVEIRLISALPVPLLVYDANGNRLKGLTDEGKKTLNPVHFDSI